MSALPIRVRLTLAFALAMAVVLAALGVLVYLRVGDALLSSVDQSLRRRLARRDARAERGGSSTPTPRRVRRLRRSSTRHGAPYAARRRLALAPLLDRRDAARRGRRRDSSRGRSRFRTTRASGACSPSAPAASGAVVVARSLRRATRLSTGSSRELLIAEPARVAARLARGLRACGRGAPPRRGDAAPGRLDHGGVAGRCCPCLAARDEISRLAETLNDMLARLHAAFEHERRFVADASHELRTPLALLRTELELALRRPRTHAGARSARSAPRPRRPSDSRASPRTCC